MGSLANIFLPGLYLGKQSELPRSAYQHYSGSLILHKLAEETKALEKNVSPDIEKTYKQEFDDVQGKWNKLKVKVSKDLHLLEEITPKLRTFEVNQKATRRFSLLQSKVVIVSKYLLFEQFAFFLVPCLLMYLRWDIKFQPKTYF